MADAVALAPDAQVAAALRGVRLRGALARRGLWGVGDQVLVSATNFTTNLLVARAEGPRGFGVFAVLSTVLLLTNSVQSALIAEPHNVLGPQRPAGEYADYTTSTAAVQVLLAAGMSVLALTAAAVARLLGHPDAAAIAALACAIGAWQLQEFLRRVLYSRGRASAAFANDVVSYGGQMCWLGALAAAGCLTTVTALYGMAATSLTAAVCGAWTLRRELGGRVLPRFVRENWDVGKWLCGATLAGWLGSQAYPLLTAGLLGAASTGIIRSAQNLVAPTHVLINAFQAVATPYAAAEHGRRGRAGLVQLLTRASLAMFTPLAAYLLVVGLLADRLLRAVYGPSFGGHAFVVWLWCAYYLVAHVGRTFSIALTVVRQTRAALYAQLVTVALTCTLGVASIRAFGVTGAMAAAVATQLASAVTLWRLFARAGRAAR